MPLAGGRRQGSETKFLVMDANGHTKSASIMEQKYHIIDPDGEVILVLRDANPPFAVWKEDENIEKETEKQ